METSKTQASIIGVVAAAIIVSAVAILMYSYSIHSTGIVTSLEIKVYQDSNLKIELSSINWGNIRAGEIKAITCYIKNIKNTPLTLSLATGKYLPLEAQQYLTTSWNYINGTVLAENQVQQVTITLSVDSNTVNVTNFEYNIIITGTEKT